MPQIFYHYIECTWGACYNSLHPNCIVPYLDSVDVVDYVLRSPVIHDIGNVARSSTGARIYPELADRLKEVCSPAVVEYVRKNFSSLTQ